MSTSVAIAGVLGWLAKECLCAETVVMNWRDRGERTVFLRVAQIVPRFAKDSRNPCFAGGFVTSTTRESHVN